jgi:hypothetical protein
VPQSCNYHRPSTSIYLSIYLSSSQSVNLIKHRRTRCSHLTFLTRPGHLQAGTQSASLKTQFHPILGINQNLNLQLDV